MARASEGRESASSAVTFEKNGTTEMEQIKTHETAIEDRLLEQDRHQTLWQAAKSHKLVLLHSLAAFSAGCVFGYDVVVNGASISMPAFLIHFGAVTGTGELYLPSIWTSLWTAMTYLAQAIGGLVSSPVSDKVGRKWVCVASCLISLIGVGIQYAANTRGLLLAGKMINGFAVGCLMAAATAWASEISPMRLRGPIQSAIVLFITVMQGLALGIIRTYIGDVTPHAFRTVFVIQFAWPVVTGAVYIFMPESPNWLMLKGRVDDARKSIQRLYGKGDETDARVALLQKEIDQERSMTAEGVGSYAELFKGSNLKRTLTVCWLFLGTGLNGAAFLAQNVYFLIIAGLKPVHAFDIGIGGFGVAVLTIIASWFWMEKFGRRSIWLSGVAMNIIVMAIIGGLHYVQAHAALWAIAILMNILIAWQILTMTSVAYVVTAEISSYRLRAKTQSVGIVSLAVVTWLFTFVVPYMYNTDSGNLGARTGFIFAGSSILLLIGSYFIVPDLQGFAIEEIDWLYANSIPVRHFQRYNDGRAKQGAAMGTV